MKQERSKFTVGEDVDIPVEAAAALIRLISTPLPDRHIVYSNVEWSSVTRAAIRSVQEGDNPPLNSVVVSYVRPDSSTAEQGFLVEDGRIETVCGWDPANMVPLTEEHQHLIGQLATESLASPRVQIGE